MRVRLGGVLLPARCHHCSAPAASGAPLCASCIDALTAAAYTPGHGGRCSAYRYAGPARSLVHALKFRGGAALAPWMARRLVAVTGESRFAQAVLVPVPAHPAHAARRGYDQAALLAHAIGAELRLPVCGVLERHANAKPQTGAPRDQRIKLPKEAFRLIPDVTRALTKNRQFPTNVVVCDDVATTGVTLDICASLVRELFTGELLAVTFAHAERARLTKRGRSFGTD